MSRDGRGIVVRQLPTVGSGHLRVVKSLQQLCESVRIVQDRVLGHPNGKGGVVGEQVNAELPRAAMVKITSIHRMHLQTGCAAGLLGAVSGTRIDHHHPTWLAGLGLHGRNPRFECGAGVQRGHQQHNARVALN